MSHYTVLVITPTGLESEAVQLLAPFSAHLAAPEYDKVCWCVGISAQQRIHKQVEKEFEWMNFKEVRHQPEYETMQLDAFIAKWKELYNDPFSARQAELCSQDPGMEIPIPDCSDCHGSGMYKTTYNPLTKWDWYLLGGRWELLFQGVQQQLLSEFLKFYPHIGGTFAILTPNGEWYEKGRIGWMATVSDAVEPTQWNKFVQEILEKYSDHYGLIYDCHN